MDETVKSEAIARRRRSGRRIRRATAVAGAGALVTGGLLTVALAPGSPAATTAHTSTQAAGESGGDDDATSTSTSTSTSTTTSNAPAAATSTQGSATTSGGS